MARNSSEASKWRQITPSWHGAQQARSAPAASENQRQRVMRQA